MPKRAAISSGLESSTGLGMGGGVVSARTSPKNPTCRTNELTIASPTKMSRRRFLESGGGASANWKNTEKSAVLQKAPVARQREERSAADARGILFAAAQDAGARW